MIPKSWSCGVSLFSHNNDKENIPYKRTYKTYQNLKDESHNSEGKCILSESKCDGQTTENIKKSNQVIVARPGLVIVKNAKSMCIKAEKTSNPRVLLFYPDIDILNVSNTTKYKRKSLNIGNPLVRNLFKIDEIEEIIMRPSHISIQKAMYFDKRRQRHYSISWRILKPLIIATLLEYFSEISEKQKKNMENNDLLNESSLIIDDLINTQIRPHVQKQGGDVKFMKFDASKGQVQLSYYNRTNFTPQAITTLNSIALNILQFYLTQVKSVVPVEV